VAPSIALLELELKAALKAVFRYRAIIYREYNPLQELLVSRSALVADAYVDKIKGE